MSGYTMRDATVDKTLDLTKIKPYGDTMNDGKMQLSFTLPLPYGDEAAEAAKQLMRKMGLENPAVSHYQELTPGFTFLVCYGECSYTVDYSTISVPKVQSDTMSMEETDEYIKENIGRKIVVIGASTGTDAHTVGIDAIMNMKGFAGLYCKSFGIERGCYAGIANGYPERRPYPKYDAVSRIVGSGGVARQNIVNCRRAARHP